MADKGPAKMYSSFAAFAFTVNYVIGVGVLSVPYAFYAAGEGMAMIILVTVTMLSYIGMVWVLEAMCRMEGLTTILNLNSNGQPIDEDDPTRPLTSTINENVGYGVINSDSESTMSANKFKITERKFEVNELCRFFLGPFGQRFYEVAVAAYLFGSLWGFSSIFGTTMADTIPFIGLSQNVWPCTFYTEEDTPLSPECFTSYQLFVLFFAAIVVPISLLDLSEQVIIQITLVVYRFLAFLVMISTSLAALFVRPYDPDHNPSAEPPYVADGVGWFKIAGFGVAFSTCVFAQLTHHSIPGLAQPIRDKSKLAQVFFWSLMFTFFFYALMGVIVSIYFGPGTKEMVALNWQFPDSTPGDAEWYEFVVRYLIVLFPVALAISAFPLTVVTLGNNIFAALPAEWTKNQTDKRVKLATRLMASLPALLCGAFVYNLSTIVQFTGLMGVFLAFIFPALLQHTSRRRVVRHLHEDYKTPYTTWYSSAPFVWGIFAFGVGAFVIMLILIIKPDLFGEIQ